MTSARTYLATSVFLVGMLTPRHPPHMFPEKVICITLVMGIAESNDKKILAVFGASSGLLIACNLFATIAKVTGMHDPFLIQFTMNANQQHSHTQPNYLI